MLSAMCAANSNETCQRPGTQRKDKKFTGPTVSTSFPSGLIARPTGIKERCRNHGLDPQVLVQKKNVFLW